MITVPVVHGNFVPLPLAEPAFRMRHSIDPKALGRMNIEVKLALPNSSRVWLVDPNQFIENIDDDFIYVRADPKLTGEACSLGIHWVVGELWEEKKDES